MMIFCWEVSEELHEEQQDYQRLNFRIHKGLNSYKTFESEIPDTTVDSLFYASA